MNTVKYLVNNRADINTKDDKGVCLWDYSSENILFWKQELIKRIVDDKMVFMFEPTEWRDNLGKDTRDPAGIQLIP